MPSNTPKQARTMAGAAHDPAFAEKVGIPQSVAKDFNQADAGTGMIRPATSKIRRPHGLTTFPHKTHSRSGR